MITATRWLDLRQYKNGLFSVKIMLVLKLPHFFPPLHGKGKRAAISKLACVLQKRIRSYIVLALDLVSIWKLLFTSLSCFKVFVVVLCTTSTGCQLSSGTPFSSHFSTMALISIDCYTLNRFTR